MSNVVLDRVCARMLSAALRLNDAADGIEDRDAISLSELEDLRLAISATARSLDLCSSILNHMEADALNPASTAEAVDKRAANEAEAHALTIIHNALAGKRNS